MTGYPIFFKKKENTLFFEKKKRIPLILDDGGVVSLLQLLSPKDIRTGVFYSDRKKLDPADKTKISGFFIFYLFFNEKIFKNQFWPIKYLSDPPIKSKYLVCREISADIVNLDQD
jgi:hypothetical protein